MAEKIYDRNGLPQLVRSSVPYKMTTDTDGQPCYRELSVVEVRQRLDDAAAHHAERAKPPLLTLEERVAALENRK